MTKSKLVFTFVQNCDHALLGGQLLDSLQTTGGHGIGYVHTTAKSWFSEFSNSVPQLTFFILVCQFPSETCDKNYTHHLLRH